MYLENTKITELDNNLTEEEKRKNLKNFYDVVNGIAKRLHDGGKDVSKYFLTKQEYDEIRTNKEKTI